MSLSSLIVQREIASLREVEEALARQVLYGGDLVTNLLEVCRLDEAALLPLVAASLGLAPAPNGELPPPDPEAKRLIAAEVAIERSLAPLSLDRDGLTVAVAAPLAPDVEHELAFALALPISQRIAPLVRIKQALARDYGAPLERRFLRLLRRMTSNDAPERMSYPPIRNADTRIGAPRPPSVMPEAPSSNAPPPERPSVPQGGGARTLVRQREVPSARPPRRRRGAMTVVDARVELEEAAERDAIFDVLFDFVRQYFDYTAVFTAHGELAEGRDAFGDGAARDTVARILVPLDVPSLLSAARTKKAVLQRVPSADGLDSVLMNDLGRSGATGCVVLPVIVRSRVVALLLGDGGKTGIEAKALADLERIIALATAAFERVIVRRKLEGSPRPGANGESEAASRVSIPPSAMLNDTGGFAGRPSVEELAPPIRELLTELDSRAGPAEGESRAPAPAVTAPSSLGRSSPRSRSRRGEAPKLEFGAVPTPSSVFGECFDRGDVERQLLAEVQGREAQADSARAAAVAPPPSSEMLSDEDPDVSVQDMSYPRLPDDREDTRPDQRETPIAPLVAEGPGAASTGTPVAVVRAVLSSRPLSPHSMPASEQQVSVSLRKPPSSQGRTASLLPSVIVDVAGEYVALVERVVAGDRGAGHGGHGGQRAQSVEEAEAELLRAGGYAMPAIMARFPGPVTIDAERLTDGSLPRVAECGPVLRLIASQRRTALPFVLSHVADRVVEIRFWATYLLTELVYPDVLEPIVGLAFDEEPRVRRAARAAARAFADAHPSTLVERFDRVAADRGESLERRRLAVEVLGETCDALAVPALVPLLDDPTGELSGAARTALVSITRQDFGTASAKWRAWWTQNRERHRLEWLIDSLMHEQPTVRAAAGEELQALTKEDFGYFDGLPKRERERAQARYREWWSNVGRVRLSRQTSRG